MNENELKNAIAEYEKFKLTDKYNEKYKWDYVEKHKHIFDNLDHLQSKIEGLKNQNFMPYIWRFGMFKLLAKSHELKFKKILSYLFDENIDLLKRIQFFKNEIIKILKVDANWKNKKICDPKIDSASFFLFLKDYKKYLLFTKMNPFKNFIIKFQIKDYFKNFKNNDQKYIAWINFCNEVLIPMMNKFNDKENTLLDCQDFIWFVEDKYKKKSSISKKLSINKKEDNYSVKLINSKKQIILYGPAGTGKTYSTKKLALEVIENE